MKATRSLSRGSAEASGTTPLLITRTFFTTANSINTRLGNNIPIFSSPSLFGMDQASCAFVNLRHLIDLVVVQLGIDSRVRVAAIAELGF